MCDSLRLMIAISPGCCCGSILDGESLSAFHSRRSLSQRTNNSRASGERERDHRNLLAGRLKMWTNSLQHALRLVVVWLLIIVIIVFGVRRKRWCLTLHTFHCRQHGRVQRDDATIAVSGWYTWLSINWNTMRRLVWAIPCARSGASARQCGCLSQSSGLSARLASEFKVLVDLKLNFKLCKRANWATECDISPDNRILIDRSVKCLLVNLR